MKMIDAMHQTEVADVLHRAEYRAPFQTEVAGLDVKVLAEPINRLPVLCFEAAMDGGVVKVSGGVVHNEWVPEQRIQAKKDTVIWLNYQARFQTQTVVIEGAENTFRKPGPTSVAVRFLTLPEGTDPPHSNNPALMENSRRLAIVRFENKVWTLEGGLGIPAVTIPALGGY